MADGGRDRTDSVSSTRLDDQGLVSAATLAFFHCLHLYEDCSLEQH